MDGELRSAPSRIALRCAACGCFVTPCLVCSRPVAARTHRSSGRTWKDCEYCGLRNPLDDQTRELLGLPTPFALPLATVRRVQVALIGRRTYTLALYMHKSNLEGDKFPKRAISTAPFCLLEEQGVIIPAQDEANDRNSMEQAHTTTACAAADDRTTALDHDKIAKCGGCGLRCEMYVSQHSVSDEELQLVQCNAQLLHLHCSEALSEDLSCSSFAYPICRTSANLRITRTCSSSVSCGAVQQFTCFSLKILELAHGMLTVHTQLLKEAEEAVAAAEKFLNRQAALQDVQMSTCMAKEALKQASRDCKALMDRRLCASVSGVLEAFIVDKLEERQELAKRHSEEFVLLLHMINALLEHLFLLARGFSADCNSCGSKQVLDAVRMAMPQWILLFHDVAHATGALLCTTS